MFLEDKLRTEASGLDCSCVCGFHEVQPNVNCIRMCSRWKERSARGKDIHTVMTLPICSSIYCQLGKVCVELLCAQENVQGVFLCARKVSVCRGTLFALRGRPPEDSAETTFSLQIDPVKAVLDFSGRRDVDEDSDFEIAFE